MNNMKRYEREKDNKILRFKIMFDVKTKLFELMLCSALIKLIYIFYAKPCKNSAKKLFYYILWVFMAMARRLLLAVVFHQRERKRKEQRAIGKMSSTLRPRSSRVCERPL